MSPLLTRAHYVANIVLKRVCLILVISGNDPSLIRFLPARSRISCLGEGGNAACESQGLRLRETRSGFSVG